MLSSRFLTFDYTWSGLEAAQTWKESGIKTEKETFQAGAVNLALVTHSRARARPRGAAASPRAEEPFWNTYGTHARACQGLRSFWKEFYLFRKYFWKYLHVKITCLNSLTKQALGRMQNF